MATIFLQKDAQQLLKNKCVVVMGGSIQRSIYKDMIRLIQGNTYLTDNLLRMKGEDSCLGDKLIDGGMRGADKKGVGYREVRQYITDFYFLQFVFMTRSYNSYVESVINKFAESENKPDVIIVNSCLWDITRYGKKPVPEYKQNLHKLFKKLKTDLPNCLVIWNTNPAISHNPKGGVFVPGTDYLKDSMELHVLEANYYASKAAIEYGHDVIDLHYFLRHQIHRRAEDGIHWDMTGHRRITNLILSHIAQTWEVEIPRHIKVVIGEEIIEPKKDNEHQENKDNDRFKEKFQNKFGCSDGGVGDFKSLFDIDKKPDKPNENSNDQRNRKPPKRKNRKKRSKIKVVEDVDPSEYRNPTPAYGPPQTFQSHQPAVIQQRINAGFHQPAAVQTQYGTVYNNNNMGVNRNLIEQQQTMIMNQQQNIIRNQQQNLIRNRMMQQQNMALNQQRMGNPFMQNQQAMMQNPQGMGGRQNYGQEMYQEDFTSDNIDERDLARNQFQPDRFQGNIPVNRFQQQDIRFQEQDFVNNNLQNFVEGQWQPYQENVISRDYQHQSIPDRFNPYERRWQGRGGHRF